MDGWEVPGFRVGELLGFGATGEVWRARELATGEQVALKRLRPGAPAGAAEALRREAEALRALTTPYVVRLREVLGAGADAVLVLDLAEGGSLAALLARRGPLTPGECVTVAVPLAQALAAAHARGLVHGDVSPANVLFTADGMPLLGDLGVARAAGDLRAVEGTAEYVDPRVAGGGLPDAASDVWALGALVHQLLCGSPPHEGSSSGDVMAAAVAGGRAPLGLLAPQAPRPLVATVEAALSLDASARPSAAALAVALQRAHPAAPVRLVPVLGPVAQDVRPTHRVARHVAPPPPPRSRRRPSGWVVVTVAVVVVLLGGGMAWAFSGAGGISGPRLEPAGAAPPAPDWPGVLDGLDRARERAFAGSDPGVLADVYSSRASARAADEAALAQLAASGLTAVGVRHELRSVDVVTAGPDRVALRVLDVLAAHQLRDVVGGVVEQRPGRGEAAFDVELVRQDDRWLLATVVPQR